MTLRWLLPLAPLLIASCGPLEGSYSVTWKGTVLDAESSGSLTVALRDGDQWLLDDATAGQLNCPNADCNLVSVDPQQVPAMITQNLGVPPPTEAPEDYPPVRLQLFNLYHVPLVGKGAAQGFLQVGGTQTTVNVDITRVRLTGSTNDPIVVEGAFDDQHAAGQNAVTGQRSDVAASGTFSVVVSCSENAPTRGRFMCSPVFPTDADKDKATFYGDSNVIAPPWPPSLAPVPEACPAEIWAAVGGKASFDGGSLDLGGQKLSCSAHFCSGTMSVDADGCSWDVTTIADVGIASLTTPGAAGSPANTELFVSAVAKDGCKRDVTFCQARP